MWVGRWKASFKKEERNISAVVKKERKNRSGTSHLLLRLFNRTHILILFIALEFMIKQHMIITKTTFKT